MDRRATLDDWTTLTHQRTGKQPHNRTEILATPNVRVKDPTPRTDYQGQTYCFCSEDCRVAFVKNPGKYLPKRGDRQATVPN